MTIPPVNIDRMVRTFMDLVQIDSPSKKESAVADYIEALLKPLSLQVWRDDAGQKIEGECGNLHVRMPARESDAGAVLFSAHLDCVMPCIGVKPVLKDGIIRSDGTTVLGSDDKAGVTSILEMLFCLLE